MSATLGTRIHTWLHGKYVGQDAFGNRYYVERKPKGEGRHKRWVIYNGMPEPSKVPPRWHFWLHYTTDILPSDQPRERYVWEKPHLPNLTGTGNRYLPPSLKGQQRAPSTSDYQAWTPE